MKKSLICTVLISTILWGSLIACAPAAAQTSEPAPEADNNQAVTSAEPVVFVDVSPDDWFYRHVMNGLRFGLIEGTDGGRFEPDRYVTRAEFITMLGRLHEYGNETIGTPGVGEFYTRYLDWAVEMSIIHGEEYGDLMLNVYIAREQMTVLVFRYIDAFELWIYALYVNGPTISASFQDYHLISCWAKTAAETLGEWNLSVSRPGFPGYFRPQDYATHAEVVGQLAITALRLYE